MEKVRILIVEDQRIVAEDLKLTLKNLGYKHCKITSSGEKALAAIETFHPDLILMDIILHGKLSGIDTADEIHSRFGTAVIYVTAHADKSTLESVKKTEPYGYILKPFNDKELQVVIETALYKHNLEKKLKESEKKYRTLQENIPVGVFRTTLDGRVISANKAVATIMGYNKLEDILDFKKISVSWTAKTSMDLLRILLKNKELIDYEVQVQRKDGKTIWLSLNARLVPDESGKMNNIDGIMADITKRKETEQKLKEEEQWFRMIFDGARDALVITNPDGSIKALNEAACQLLGYTKTEMENYNIHDMHKGKDLKAFETTMKKIMAGESVVFEAKLSQKNGNLLDVEFSSQRIQVGESIYIRTTARDITQRKQIERALHQSREQYRLVTELASDYAYALKVQTKRILRPEWVTEAFSLITGYTEDEISNWNGWIDMTHDKDKSLMKRRYNLLTSGQPHIAEYRIITKSGKVCWLRDYARPVWDEAHEKVVKIIGAAQDITERKTVEEELIQSHKILRNLFANLHSVREEERTRISREIHDELGQALTALKMDLFWLRGKTPSDNKTIQDKTASMLELLDATIQTVRKISTELRPGLLDDLGLVAAIEWQAEDFNSHTGIQYDLTVTPSEIELDQNRSTALFRIFQETLTNVTRHAKASCVTIHLKEENRNVVLIIKDNGIGITPEQIKSPSSLGLIGMKERIYPFQGKMLIRGKPKKGTTVRVSLPLSAKETKS